MSFDQNLNALVAPGRPVKNRLIFIEISGLTALDGSELDSDVEIYYSTQFDPLYSSVMRVRFLAGEFLEDVPDATIDQILAHFSYQADLLNYNPSCAAIDAERYREFRARWVTAATIVMLLSGTSVNSEMQKRLGDLSVKRKGAAQELLNEMRRALRELTMILEDGGKWGRNPETVTKSINHPDFPVFGRLWAPNDMYSGEGIPAANVRRNFVRSYDSGVQRRTRKTFRKFR